MKNGTELKLKFKVLQRRLGIPLYRTVGLLESLWLATYQNAPAGDIGKLTNEEIAATIEWDGAATADEMVAALVDCRWLDVDDEYRLVVHDWSHHCAKYLKGAFASHKKPFADEVLRDRPKHPAISTPAIATCPKTPTTNSIQSNSIQAKPIQHSCSTSEQASLSSQPDLQVDPEQPNSSGPNNGSRNRHRVAYPAEFERWYAAYPRHVGKDKAATQYARTIKRLVVERDESAQAAAEWLVGVTEIYAASPAGQQGTFTPHPSRWLLEGRFNDDPNEWRLTGGKSKSQPTAGKQYDPGAKGDF